jgi:chorismate synthase
MGGLSYLTAGESHGVGFSVIVSGFPAGLALDVDAVNRVLAERQCGYGRGERMAMETDTLSVTAGLRHGVTLGTPLGLAVSNRDHSIETLPPVTRPRPGHADLAGCMKYGWTDARGVLERASARETVARTMAGAVAGQLLDRFGVRLFSHVLSIGTAQAPKIRVLTPEMEKAREASDVFCLDPAAGRAMVEAIRRASEDGDTLGGVVEVLAMGVVPGLGSPDRRLDARLARALMAVQAIKGVEVGEGFALAAMTGSQVHDEIVLSTGPGRAGLCRPTNRAGGIEGGISNGETVVLRAAMKPIPTLGKSLGTVDLATFAPADASRERADTCAVPAASVVLRSVAAFELASAYCEKFGGDTVADMEEAFHAYVARLEAKFGPRPGTTPE